MRQTTQQRISESELNVLINNQYLNLHVSDEQKIEQAIKDIPKRHLIQYMATYWGDEIKEELNRQSKPIN